MAAAVLAGSGRAEEQEQDQVERLALEPEQAPDSAPLPELAVALGLAPEQGSEPEQALGLAAEPARGLGPADDGGSAVASKKRRATPTRRVSWVPHE